jgi:hypothetical protein
MEPLKIPRASNTKLTSNADINYDTLLAMANQTLDTPMAPPVDQDQLDSASGMRDLGSLAAALSGAVRGAGSVGGKLPNDFGFDQIARDMGNSRSVDLQNRMALRKQQENDMLEAIKNTGIAEQARVNKERRLKSVTPADRAIINAQLKKLFPDMNLSLPDEITYGEIEDQPVLAQSLGMGAKSDGSSGLSFGDRMALENAKMGFQGTQNDADRNLKDEQARATLAARAAELEAQGKSKSEALALAKQKMEQDAAIAANKIRSQEKLAQLRAQQSKNKTDAVTAAKTDKETRDKAAVYTKRMNDGKVPQTWNAVQEIEKIVRKYPKGDIPGIGLAARAKNIKLFGVPVTDQLNTDDDRRMRAAFQKLKNLNLKELSGAQVTANEMERFETAYASGNANEFRIAFESLQKDLRANTRNLISGFDGAVIDAAVANGGTDFRPFLPKVNETTGDGQPSGATPGKRKVFVP